MRRIATAPSQTAVTSLERAGSPTRSRGTQSRGAGPPSEDAHAQLEHPEARVREPLRYAGQRVGRGEAGVVVEEEQQLAGDSRDAGVAPGRDPAVLLERDGADAGSPSGCQPLPTTTTSSSTPVWAASESSAAASSAGRRPWVSTMQPTAHRRRSEVRIATRCPMAVIAVMTTSAITRTREPIRSPATASTIAAASASIVASIATNAR